MFMCLINGVYILMRLDIVEKYIYKQFTTNQSLTDTFTTDTFTTNYSLTDIHSLTHSHIT